MKTGKTVWLVSGNYNHDKAVELVEKAREKLQMDKLEQDYSEVTDVNAIALDEKVTYTIDVPLKDKKNENSCLLSYFEVGFKGDDLKQELVNACLMQWISEPFFDQLRTKQQLGYVVTSFPKSHRDVFGNCFLIQSPKKSCEYLAKALNEFLLMKREDVKKLTKEEFEVQRMAVNTKISV